MHRLCSLPLLLLALSSPASAQSDTERARERFEAGLSYMDAHQYGEAADAFRQTLEIRDTPQVRFNLATALHQNGDIAEAAEHFEIVAGERSAPQALRRESRRLLRQIEPELGRLTVNVEGDAAGTELTLDGLPIPAERIGTPIRVAAGRHVVGARQGEREGNRAVDVTAGETATITLRLGAAATPTQAPAVDDTEPLPSPTDTTDPATDETTGDDGGGGSVLGKWWFWTIIGALVVGGIVVGAVLAQPGQAEPLQGNLSPGFLEVRL